LGPQHPPSREGGVWNVFARQVHTHAHTQRKQTGKERSSSTNKQPHGTRGGRGGGGGVGEVDLVHAPTTKSYLHWLHYAVKSESPGAALVGPLPPVLPYT
jgi:hypothetical protein